MLNGVCEPLAFLVSVNTLLLHLLSREHRKLFKEEKKNTFPKKSISIQSTYCSVEIYCGLFPQGRQKKLGFHLSDVLQEKDVPNPYNYILVSAFKKVSKKER